MREAAAVPPGPAATDERGLARRARAALSLAGVVVLALAACEETRPNGSPCIKSRDCESGHCRSGLCAAPPSANPGQGGFGAVVGTGGAAGAGGGGAGGMAGGSGAGASAGAAGSGGSGG